MAPDAHNPGKKVPTMMATADMALKMDPELRQYSEKFRGDHEAFRDAWARPWFKLTHCDMGPKVRYLGPQVPAEIVRASRRATPCPQIEISVVSASSKKNTSLLNVNKNTK